MPWSICATGMPEPVRANLAHQFAFAKRNGEKSAAELTTLEAIEKAVDSELAFLITQGVAKTAVRVTCAGSDPAGSSLPLGQGMQLELKVECLPEFLLHERIEDSDEA